MSPGERSGKKDIRSEIAGRRRARINRLGFEEGLQIPKVREVPLFNFNTGQLLICEIKRRSPSRGDILEIQDAVNQAVKYKESGIDHISVLTEPDYFGGSLEDLLRVKRACPDVCVLRKDFLFSVEDIEVSYRAGADACLLIASLLDQEDFEEMHDACLSFGMTPLVEVHSAEDIEKIKDTAPVLVGINSRDLKTFRIYPMQPLKLQSILTWECRTIYESGIMDAVSGDFVLRAGFSGILVGEGVLRRPSLVGELKGLIEKYEKKPDKNPWGRLYRQRQREKPLVKICGLTRREDFDLAVNLGADMTGFIFAQSPRKTTPEFVRSLPPSGALKVGVVVLKKGEPLPDDILSLLYEDFLDLIQFHGEESPAVVWEYGYKTLKVEKKEDLEKISDYYPLPCLIEPFSPDHAGGSGKRLGSEFVSVASEMGELWLAGGLNADNIREVLSEYTPDLVDISSGLEEAPGLKNHDKMKKFFKEIRIYAGT